MPSKHTYRRTTWLRGAPSGIQALQRNWKSLRALDRAAAITQLVKAGCSRRTLAKQLGISEGNVRWHLLVESLPAAEKEAIAGGAGSWAFVEALRKKKADQRRAQSLAVERNDASISGSHAAAVCKWLQQELPSRSYRQQLVAEIELREALKLMPASTMPIRGNALSPNPEQSLAQCRPERRKPTYGPELLEYLLHWFFRWLSAALPRDEIRDRVLDNVKKTVG